MENFYNRSRWYGDHYKFMLFCGRTGCSIYFCYNLYRCYSQVYNHIFLLLTVSSVSRPMTLRFLHVKNGKDMTDLNSFFFKTALGNSQMFDLKTLFYNEIEDAIERRKQQDQLIS